MKINKKNIKLSKKQIILILICTLLIIAVTLIFLFIPNHTNNTETISNKDSSIQKGEYADDSKNALNSFLQTYSADDTKDTFFVYADMQGIPDIDVPPSVEMTETCTYTDKEDADETTYIIGEKPTKVKNHCLLSFKEQKIFYLSEQGYLNAYIVLPDNSLIALNTYASPSIQVNIYKNEIRVVQLNGYAYYRIAKKTNNNIFTVQIADHILEVTGTEFFTQAGYDPNVTDQTKSTFWATYQLLEGSANVRVRGAEDIVRNIAIPDEYNYGKNNNSSDADWRTDAYGSTYSYAFTYLNGVSQTADSKAAAVYIELPSDFISDQVKWTLQAYGFGNFFNFKEEGLQALVCEQIESAAKLREDTVANAYAEQEALWDKWEDIQKNSSSGYTSSSTNTCKSGYYYVGNGSCCPNKTYLGTDGYCHYASSSSGSSSGSSGGTPTYYYSDEEQCYNEGSASYQLFCQMSKQGTVKNGKCCIDL